MSKFAIFVTVKVAPGKADEFLPIILENATAAVRDEADCHMFRVLRNKDEPDTFHFFEVYTNEAALDAHRETPHYKKFRELGDPLMIDRQLTRVDVLQ